MEMPLQRDHFPLGTGKIQEVPPGGEWNREPGVGRAVQGRKGGVSKSRAS